MISLEQVKQTQDELFKLAQEIVSRKGADYNREQQENGDTLHNLRVCALSGVVRSPQKGILVRLSDKLQRLNSLENPAETPVNKDESVRDTVLDIINYISYFYLFYQEERGRPPAEVKCDNRECKDCYPEPKERLDRAE